MIGLQKGVLDKGLGAERTARDELKTTILDAVEMLNSELRREIGNSSSIQTENNAKVLKLVEQQTDDFRKSLQTALQNLDVEIRKVIRELSAEHHGKHSNTESMLVQLDSSLRSEMVRMTKEAQNSHVEMINEATTNTVNTHLSGLGDLDARFQDLMAQYAADLQGRMDHGMDDLQQRILGVASNFQKL